MSELKRVHKWNTVAGNEYGDEKLYTLYIDLINEEFEELLTAKNRKDKADALGDLLTVVVGACHGLDIDADTVLGRVTTSNFSKYDYSVEDAEYSVQQYLDDPRYKNVRYEKVGHYYVIRGDKVDGGENKILKSHNYEEPKLGDL